MLVQGEVQEFKIEVLFFYYKQCQSRKITHTWLLTLACSKNYEKTYILLFTSSERVNLSFFHYWFLTVHRSWPFAWTFYEQPFTDIYKTSKAQKRSGTLDGLKRLQNHVHGTRFKKRKKHCSFPQLTSVFGECLYGRNISIRFISIGLYIRLKSYWKIYLTLISSMEL